MNVRRRVGLLALIGAIAAMGQIACRKAASAPASLQVTSPNFAPGGDIPAKYTCDGTDTSPALSWSGQPQKTQALVLVVDDPDAGNGFLGFTHWTIYNLPPDTRGLPEGTPQQRQLASGALQGENGFDKIGYGGPCPPGTSAHHYVFHLYALDTKVQLPAGASPNDLERAIEGHILAQGQLIGLYRHPH